MMEFFSSTMHKARKPHKCEACGKTIQPGDTYRMENGKWEGDFFTRAWCEDCCNIMDYFFDFLASENEFDYDEVYYEIQERFCYRCEHGQHDEDDCPEKYSVWHCPRIQDSIFLERGEKKR
jgi:hypothetical protein